MISSSLKTIAIALAFTACLGINAQQADYIPTDENLRARQEFQDNKLGVFIHWGVYSMLADGEWVMLNKHIDRDEYAQLPAGFYPSRFNADEWVQAIKDAGPPSSATSSRNLPTLASAMASNCISTIPTWTGIGWTIRWDATRMNCPTIPLPPTGHSITNS